MKITLLAAWIFGTALTTFAAAEGRDLFSDKVGANLTPLNGKLRYLRDGAQLYEDKDFTLKQRPTAFKTVRYVLAPYGGVEARCDQGGIAFALALQDSNHTEERDNVRKSLELSGWQPVPDTRPFALFYTNGADREGGLFWKELQDGDEVKLPVSTILCFNPAKMRLKKPASKTTAPAAQ